MSFPCVAARCWSAWMVAALLWLGGLQKTFAEGRSAQDIVGAAPAFSLGAKELLALRGAKPPPGLDVEVLLDDTVLRFDAQGRATLVYHSVYRVLTDQGAKSWGGIGASYHPWHENKPAIRAKVITREGAAFTLDEKTLVDALAAQQDGNVYSDRRRVDGPLPAVRAGSVVETEIVLSEHKPMFGAGSLRRLSFGVSTYTSLTRVRVEHPSTLAVAVRPRSGAPAGVSSTSGELRSTTFSMSDLLPLASWPSAANPETPLLPSIEVGTAKSWAAVAAGYAQVVDAALATFDARPIVARVLAPNDSADAKLQRLLAHVHAEVRYTGLELGEHSIVPNAPSEVLERHYGDCKDKSALLVALLRAAGFDASLALLASGSGTDVPSDVAGFGLFDHVIVYVAGKTPLWIDPTAPYAPVGVLPYGDQDRLALVASAKTKQLVRTPRTRAEDSTYTEEVHIDFPQLGKAAITETLQGSGAMLSDLRGSFDQDADQLKERLKSYAQRRYGATLQRAQADEVSNLTRPFLLTMEAKDPPQIQTYDDGGFVTVTPDAMYSYLPEELYAKPLSERSKEEKEKAEQHDPRYRPAPTVDFYLSKPHHYVIRYRLTVPDGFVWHALPDAMTLEAGGIRVQRSAKAVSPREAQVTFELGATGRLVSAARLEEVRKVLYTFDQQASFQLRFVPEVEQAINENKVAEALSAQRALLARNPNEVAVASRYARSLLRLGLGMEARRVADKIRKDFPKSAHAHWTHSLIYMFDELGRDSYPGANFAVAEQSLRTAISLAPDEPSYLEALAVVVQRRATRTYPPDRKAFEELDPLLTKLYREFQHKKQGEPLLRNLLWLQRYQEAAKLAEELEQGTNRHAWGVAAVASLEGAPAAQRKAEQLAGGNPATLLGAALGTLVVQRRYETARALADLPLVKSDFAAIRRIIDAALRRDQCIAGMAPLARAAYDQLTPVLHDAAALEELSAYFEAQPKGSVDAWNLQPAIERFIDRASFFGKDTPFVKGVLAADAGPCFYTWEAQEEAGAARVTLVAPDETRGQDELTLFMRREKRGYRLIGAHSKGRLLSYATGLTHALADKKLDEARVWLRWARAQVDAEEPQPSKLNYFTALRALWPEDSAKASSGELAAMAAILDWVNNKKTRAGVIEGAYRRAASQPDRARSLRWFYAHALAADKPSEAANLFGELRKELPEDKYLWQLHLSALLNGRRFSELKPELEAYQKRYPDEDFAAKQWNRMDTEEGRYAAALARSEQRRANKQASKSELNVVAWDALFMPGADLAQPLELARAACDPEDKADYGSLHTLSVLLAQMGRPNEAYVAYKAAMTNHSSKRVWPADWLMVGRMAEALGLEEAARDAYARAQVLESDGVRSSGHLAKQRLERMAKSAR